MLLSLLWFALTLAHSIAFSLRILRSSLSTEEAVFLSIPFGVLFLFINKALNWIHRLRPLFFIIIKSS